VRAASHPSFPPVTGSLIATAIARAHGTDVVLDGVDVTVGPGARIGVVGPNGVGKSTLLRILAGLERPDRGSVERAPADLAVGYLAQEHDARAGETALEYLARHTGVAEAESEMERLAALLPRDPKLAQPYADAVERWTALGGPDLEPRAAVMAAEVGLGTDAFGRRAGELSGGQAARLRLAALLLSRHGVLLLDEPTNDLDFDGLERLESFVDSTQSAIVVVSHDRTFLARAVRRFLELDEHMRRATLFDGGWAAYLEERERARRRHEEAFQAYEEQRTRLSERVARHSDWEGGGLRRVRRSGETDKFIRWRMTKGAEGQAANAKRTKRALARLEDRNRVEKPWQEWQLRMEVAPRKRSGTVVARLEGAVIRRATFQLGPMDFEIRWQDRVAVVGRNGTGKSTLLGALLGTIPVVSGRRWLGPGVEVGELDQVRARFFREASLLDSFTVASGLVPGAARTLLAKYGLGAAHVTRPGRSLSPGERSRAQLALLAARGVNCLVLDEPTNHLDLPAIEQLEEVLDRYPGTVVLVTHDRALLDQFRPTVVIDVEVLPSLPIGQ